MQPWSQFYATVGGAAATLMGLLFVAVSINAAASFDEGRKGSRRLAEQAFQNYLAVLMVALLALFPEMTPSTLGDVLLSVTGLSAAWVIARLYLTLARPEDNESRLYALRRHLSALVGFGILVVVALRMALHLGVDRNWLASGVLVLLSSATLVSWELLIRIAKFRAGVAAS